VAYAEFFNGGSSKLKNNYSVVTRVRFENKVDAFLLIIYPNLTLPPEPIISRWGTWLSAVLYYSNNFEKIKNVVLNLDSDAAIAIKKNYWAHRM